MKQSTGFLLIFLAGFAAYASAQSYSFTTYSDNYKDGEKQGETTAMTYVVDGNRFSMSTYMNGLKVMTNIADLDDRKMTMVTYAGSKAQGMQMDMPHPDSIPPMPDLPAAEPVDAKLEPTDEVKNADGYQCRRYEMDSRDAYMEVWMLEGHDLDLLGLFHKFSGNLGGPPGQMGPTLMSIPLEKGFPMELYYEPKDDKMPTVLIRVSNLKIGDVDTSDLDVSDVQMIEMLKDQ